MSVFSLNGPLRIDPGKTGLSQHRFSFLNLSSDPICCLYITTYDDDAFGGSPDIVSGGVTINTFMPTAGAQNTVAVGNRTKLTKGKDWKRDNDSGDAEETTIQLTDCIQPGQGIEIVLKFDETLGGNEGITISPSTKEDDGTFSGIGGNVVANPMPLLLIDVIKFIFSIIPFGPLLGAVRTDEASSTVASRIGGPTSVALAASLKTDFLTTKPSAVPNLSLDAVADLCAHKGKIFQDLGFDTIRSVFEDPDMRKLVFLYQFGGGSFS